MSSICFLCEAMRKKIVLFILGVAAICASPLSIHAQTDKFQEKFTKFREKVNTDYENFWDEVNKKYADFIRQKWSKFDANPSIQQPKEESVPPIVVSPKDTMPPLRDTPLPIKEIVEPPLLEEPPKPVAPIREVLMPIAEDVVTTVRWGTSFTVRFSDDQRFTLPSVNNEAIANVWEKMSGKEYNNTIRDCLLLRMERKLNDWAYLCMLQSLSIELFGDSNEAVVFMANIFSKSGYTTRLARNNDKLYLLFACSHTIYNKGYFLIGSEKFFVFGDEVDNIEVCQAQYPDEKSLSLLVNEVPQLDFVFSEERVLSSSAYADMNVSVSVNENQIALCAEYPSFSLGDDFMTRWAMYANAPMDEKTKSALYPQLNNLVEGLSQLEAVNKLLNWVQTAFVYEYDDTVWGEDRAFFAEETLFYPYCDCEDRSILLSRLVRDILGLDVILVYYPGHLAMAVAFTEEVSGDNITVGDTRFVICDPTYINAPVGHSMPRLETDNIRVIKLERNT